MGDGLADARPSTATGGVAHAAAMGLGLVETVNDHDRLLHDGRARGIAEAILWHGGEAEAAKEAFRNADKADHNTLVKGLSPLLTAAAAPDRRLSPCSGRWG